MKTVTVTFIDGTTAELSVPDEHPMAEFTNWSVFAASTPAEPTHVTPEDVDEDLVRQVMQPSSEPASKLFVKFSCGCIGFAEPMANGRHIVVYHCDAEGDDDGWGTGLRDMSGKAFVPISVQRESEVHREMLRMSVEAGQLQTIRSALEWILRK